MSDLEIRTEAGALWLTLNRPEQFNALTGEMVIEAIQQLRGATAREDVRVVVLTGTGARSPRVRTSAVRTHRRSTTPRRSTPPTRSSGRSPSSTSRWCAG